MTRFLPFFTRLASSLIVLPTSIALGNGEPLERLSYHNPDLVVDLGVGLWAWPLPMDWNEDGLMDLVVACNDKPSNGIYVFLNSGQFDPATKLPIFSSGNNIGPSGPSPQISYIDGQALVTTSGNYHPNFKSQGFNHPTELGDPKNILVTEKKIRANQWKFLDFDADGDLDLSVGIGYWGDYGWDDAWNEKGEWQNGPLRGYVYILENRGTTAAPNYASPRQLLTSDHQPVDVYGMPSPNFADFDKDGDLDLLCGEFIDGFTYFQNVGSATEPRYAEGRRLRANGQPIAMDLCMITPVAVDFDGDSILDLVVGDEDGRVALIRGTGELQDGLPQFLPPRYFKQKADNLKFGALSAPSSADMDGDGLEDLIAGNTAGYIGFIKNLGDSPPRWAAPVYLAAGDELLRELAGPNGSIQGPAEAKWGYTNPRVADWDQDGLLDVVTNGIWGKILFYKNIGSPTHPRLAPAEAIQVEWPQETPKPDWVWWKPQDKDLVTQWRTTPEMIDWDKDGLIDLVMLDQEGYLAFFQRQRKPDGSLALLPPQRLFWSEGSSAFDGKGRPQNNNSGLLRMNERNAGGSGRRTFTLYDWDGDGTLDILANSETNVNVLRGLGKNKEGLWRFEDIGPVSHRLLAAHSTTPTIANWEGQAHLVIGAEDGFFYSMPLTK